MTRRFKSDPYLDAGMRGMIFNMAKKTYRRIAGFDLDDLVQEGYVCFYKCKARYVGPNSKGYRYTEPDGTALTHFNEDPASVSEQHLKVSRQHFSRLVQSAFANHIYDLAQKQSAWLEQPLSDLATDSEDGAEQVGWDQILPSQAEEATAMELLKSAPAEIKQLFQLLVNDALELSGYRRFGKRKTAPRETTNQRFCRLLGLSPDHDLVGAIDRHFLQDGK